MLEEFKKIGLVATSIQGEAVQTYRRNMMRGISLWRLE